jgi:osmotically-inducible protein OsmY
MFTHLITIASMTVLTSPAFAETAAQTTRTQQTVLKTKTAQDQGTSAKDTELTRSIRERIVADQSLSMRAKNITIISQNGQVTLKGPVATNVEQSKVEEIARKANGTQSVINQTQVSTNY